MAQRPLVLVAIKSRSEISLLRFYLSSSSVGRVDSIFAAQAGSSASSAKLVIGELEPGERALAAGARLRRLHPTAALVLLLDDSAPVAAPPGGGARDVDAALVRPITLERLDAVLGPLLRQAAMPDAPRVLVVDEDVQALRFVHEALGKTGCLVTAVEDVRRHLAEAPEASFDLALIDVAIPEVDGLQLCLRLAARKGERPRICMMGPPGDSEAERKAELYGADECVAKPLQARALLELVGRARLSSASLAPGWPHLRAVEGPGVGEGPVREADIS